MIITPTRTSALLGLGLFTLTGCPGPAAEPTDAGRDAASIVDSAVDAPGNDAFTPDDAFVDRDAATDPDSSTPVECTVTGYPALDAVTFNDDLSQPVFLTGAPGTTDLFVVQKTGEIIVLDSTGAEVGTFLDIPVSTASESGLLGLAFHPDYATNGLFYVYYTEPSGGSGDGPDQVVAIGTRDTAREANPDLTVILRMPDQAPNHNGGCLQFGPDGELYIATGDGGPQNDPEDDAQDTSNLLGKILRIHVGPGIATYEIPATNPFAGATEGEDEIFAYGLRNPWRMSFDRATSDLYIGDVGQSTWEEISVLDVSEASAPGTNFGWKRCEGFSTRGTGDDACAFDDHDPEVVVSHATDTVLGGGNVSITGGYVYRGTAIPGLVGAYLFGDYGSGAIGGFRYCDGETTEYQEIDDLSGLCNGLASFGQDNAGELYMVCLNSNEILHIVGG